MLRDEDADVPLAKPYTLRPYQIDAIQQARDRLASGRRAPLFVSPTGSGKTVLLAEMARLHLEKSDARRVVVVAHRRELVEQAALTLRRMGLTDVGEILPGKQSRPSAKIQVASTQTLRARKHFPPATMVIYDEAHHYSSDDWHELAKGYPDTLRIGFTATPMRSDGRGMAPAFDSLVIVATVKGLTALGYLVPCRVIAALDTSGNPLKRPALSHSPVDAYLEHAKGQRTVVFADLVENAYRFQEEFKAKDIRATVIEGTMSDGDRAKALRDHRDGAVLINCMVLTEGWDSPETSCCILARGCGSVGTYLQIVGRVLRPSPGKAEAVLIDLTGRSFVKHGPPDDDRVYSLTGKGIRDKGEADSDETYCPVCGQPIESPPNSWPCAVCGHQPEKVDTSPTYTGDELAERYAAKRAEGEEKRIETLARWFAESRAKKYRPGAALAKFRAVYGYDAGDVVKDEAHRRSTTIQCTKCVECERVVAITYRGGKCGKCAYEKTSQVKES